jgi:type IV pilus assembly protein PilO
MSKLEALQKRPWYVQLAFFVPAGVVLFALFWYFVTSGTRAETSELSVKVEELRAKNAQAQAAAQRLVEFKAAYTRAQADYDDLKAVLPEQRELTMILGNVLERAHSKMSVRFFTPKEDVQEDFYTTKVIDVGVSGSYNQLGTFFSHLSSYQRIISITDFKLVALEDKEQKVQQKGRTVAAEFKIKAYYASPENLQKITAPPAQKANAQGANPQGAPAAPAPAN